MSRLPGVPKDLVRQAWSMRYEKQTTHPARWLSEAMMAQLSFCRSEEARRLLLGLSEKEEVPA
jgi:hypothetical protein